VAKAIRLTRADEDSECTFAKDVVAKANQHPRADNDADKHASAESIHERTKPVAKAIRERR
jgi:hypothetical protein